MPTHLHRVVLLAASYSGQPALELPYCGSVRANSHLLYTGIVLLSDSGHPTWELPCLRDSRYPAWELHTLFLLLEASNLGTALFS